MIKTQVVKLKVNKTMQKHLDALCDYRRYCWNKGLETWQLMYEAHSLNKQDNLSPNERRVRDELVANKADWQYDLSARCLQLAVKDLANAWKNFFDKAQPDWGTPSFKSKKAPRQGFKTDRAKIVNGKLRLDKPRSISKEFWFDLSSYEALKMSEVKVVSIFKEKTLIMRLCLMKKRFQVNLKLIKRQQLMSMSVTLITQMDKSMFCQLNCKSFISVSNIIKEC